MAAIVPFMGELFASLGLGVEMFSATALFNAARVAAGQVFGNISRVFTAEGLQAALASGVAPIVETLGAEGVAAAELGLGTVTLAGVGQAIESAVTNQVGTTLGPTVTTGVIDTISGGIGSGVVTGLGLEGLSAVIGEESLATLASAGLTSESLGAISWKYIAQQIGIGVAVHEIIETISDKPYEFFNSVINSIISEEDGFDTTTDKLIFIDPNGRVVKNPYASNFRYIDPYQIGYESGKIAADSAVAYYERNGIDWTPTQAQIAVAMIEGTVQNPQGKEIGKRLTQYYLSPQVTEATEQNGREALRLYQQLKEVYTGEMSSDYFIDEDGNVAVYDEVGELQVYNGSRGIIEVGGMELKMPTILPGVYKFAGPLSPNDDVPADILDGFTFHHDVNYDNNGFFDFYGDLKLVARITNQFERNPNFENNSVNPYVVAYAKFVKMWFASVSPWLSKLVAQDQSRAAAYNFLQSDEMDFYSYVMGQYQDTMGYDDQPKFGFSSAYWRARRLTKNRGRELFYAGLVKAFNDSFMFYKEHYTSPEILNDITIYPID